MTPRNQKVAFRSDPQNTRGMAGSNRSASDFSVSCSDTRRRRGGGRVISRDEIHASWNITQKDGPRDARKNGNTVFSPTDKDERHTFTFQPKRWGKSEKIFQSPSAVRQWALVIRVEAEYWYARCVCLSLCFLISFFLFSSSLLHKTSKFTSFYFFLHTTHAMWKGPSLSSCSALLLLPLSSWFASCHLLAIILFFLLLFHSWCFLSLSLFLLMSFQEEIGRCSLGNRNEF